MPSAPSMKLKALVKPTIQITVSAPAIDPKGTYPANGMETPSNTPYARKAVHVVAAIIAFLAYGVFDGVSIPNPGSVTARNASRERNGYTVAYALRSES